MTGFEWAGPWSASMAALLDMLIAVLIGQWLSQPARQNTSSRWPWPVLLVLVCCASLLANGASMAGVPIRQVWPMLPAVLRTHYGHMWLAGLVCALLLLLISHWRKRWLTGAGIVLFVYCRACTGHVADAGIFRVAAAMHTLHLLAAGAWAGSVLVFLARHRTRHADGLWFDPAEARYLSQIAVYALLLVLLGGAANTWRVLGLNTMGGTMAGGVVTPPWQQPWALILKTKLVLVTLAILLGATNRWSIMPALDLNQQRAQRQFMLLLWLEAVAFVGIFACAAVLGTTSPPM